MAINPVNRSIVTAQSLQKTTKIPVTPKNEPPKAAIDHMSLGATAAQTYTPEAVRRPALNIPKGIKPGEISTTQMHGLLKRNLPPYATSQMYKSFIESLNQTRHGLSHADEGVADLERNEMVRGLPHEDEGVADLD